MKTGDGDGGGGGGGGGMETETNTQKTHVFGELKAGRDRESASAVHDRRRRTGVAVALGGALVHHYAGGRLARGVEHVFRIAVAVDDQVVGVHRTPVLGGAEAFVVGHGGFEVEVDAVIFCRFRIFVFGGGGVPDKQRERERPSGN